ncbi:MAG: hypothetical protein FWH07_02625 [Oscillospiraceae bacterium]|nr:hypothetical protein [Oscillospiraceae bacterium]
MPAKTNKAELETVSTFTSLAQSYEAKDYAGLGVTIYSILAKANESTAEEERQKIQRLRKDFEEKKDG